MKYQPNIDGNRPIYHTQIETMDHLFCNCPLAIDVWRSLFPPFLNMSNEGIIPWMNKILSDKKQGSHNLAFLLVVCWQIWDTKNQWAFKHVPPSPSKVIHIATTISRDFSVANPPRYVSCKLLERCIKWKPPDYGFSKLNFDGSIIKDKVLPLALSYEIRRVTLSSLALKEFQQTTSPLLKLLLYGKGFALRFIEIFVKFKLRVILSSLLTVCLINAQFLDVSRPLYKLSCGLPPSFSISSKKLILPLMLLQILGTPRWRLGVG